MEMINAYDYSTSSDDYSVEEIVDKRVVGGKVEYEVKWKGYPPEEKTWVGEEIINRPQLIADFQKRALERGGPHEQKGVLTYLKEEPTKSVLEEQDEETPLAHSSIADEEEEEYFVEAILDKKVMNGQVKYLVKWKGYGDDANSWEKEENMNCEELIREFERKLKKTKSHKEVNFVKTEGKKKKEDADTTQRSSRRYASRKRKLVTNVDKTEENVSNVKKDKKESLKESSGPMKGRKLSKEAEKTPPHKERESGHSQGSTGKTKTRDLPGFEHNQRPERIISATLDDQDRLMFLLKWKDCDRADWVPAKSANLFCPQIVIKYYEDRVIWQASSDVATR